MTMFEQIAAFAAGAVVTLFILMLAGMALVSIAWTHWNTS
jgi:hypothetical protein